MRQYEHHTECFHVPTFNQDAQYRNNVHIPERVKFYEVSLREGEQAGCTLTLDEKLYMAHEMDKLGIWCLEIKPKASSVDAEALRQISSWKNRRIMTAGITDCSRAGIDAVVESGADRIMIEAPISPTAGKLYSGTADENKLLERFIDALRYAQSLGLDITAQPWDLGRATPQMFERTYKNIAALGIKKMVIADTFNNLLPWTVYQMVRQIIEWTDGTLEIETHFHNDFGMATANTLMAVAAGAQTVHCSLNGIGSRTGNTPTEELAVALEVLMNVETGIDLSRLYLTCTRYAEICGIKIAPNKPVTGADLYPVSANDSASLWMTAPDSKNRASMMIHYLPQLVGAPDATLKWDNSTGAATVTEYAKQALNIHLDPDRASDISNEIRRQARIRKTVLQDSEVQKIIRK